MSFVHIGCRIQGFFWIDVAWLCQYPECHSFAAPVRRVSQLAHIHWHGALFFVRWSHACLAWRVTSVIFCFCIVCCVIVLSKEKRNQFDHLGAQQSGLEIWNENPLFCWLRLEAQSPIFLMCHICFITPFYYDSRLENILWMRDICKRTYNITRRFEMFPL